MSTNNDGVTPSSPTRQFRAVSEDNFESDWMKKKSEFNLIEISSHLIITLYVDCFFCFVIHYVFDIHKVN
jgi:hypothetical protein